MRFGRGTCQAWSSRDRGAGRDWKSEANVSKRWARSKFGGNAMESFGASTGYASEASRGWRGMRLKVSLDGRGVRGSAAVKIEQANFENDQVLSLTPADARVPNAD